MSTLARILGLLRAGPGRLAGGRLLLIDGPSGSGKSTVADAVVEQTGARLVHSDDLLAGWDGLPGLAQTLVDDVLAPLAAGRPAAYRRWDWRAGRFAASVPVPPSPLLVVEGVGAGARAPAAYAGVLVWMEADHDVRRTRSLDRDGDDFAPHWESWAAQEERHFAQEDTRARADVVFRT